MIHLKFPRQLVFGLRKVSAASAFPIFIGLFLVAFTFSKSAVASSELGVSYWHENLTSANVAGSGLVGGNGTYPIKPFGYAYYRNIGSGGLFPNMTLMYTPQQFETSGEIPIRTTKFDCYDATFFYNSSPNVELGLNGRFIDLNVTENYFSSVVVVKYRLVVPMVYMRVKHQLNQSFDFLGEARASAGQNGNLHYDVIADIATKLGNSVVLTAGYRTNYIKFKNSDIDVLLRAEGLHATLIFGL